MLKETWNGVQLARNLKKFYAADDDQVKARALATIQGICGDEKGIFLKILQLLGSTEKDDVNISHTSDLAPLSFEEFKELVAFELDKDLSAVFSEINDRPYTASLSQVHLAKLNSGEEVALKLKYPFITKKLNEQMQVLNVAPILGEFSPLKKWGINAKEYVTYLQETLEKELDYKNEAKEISYFYRSYQDIEGIRVPKVYESMSTDNLLVLSREDGYLIDEVSKYESFDTSKLSRLVIQLFVHNLFVLGRVQADANDGNFLYSLKNNGEIVLLDFGNILHVSSQVQKSLGHLIYCILENKDVDLFSLYVAMGFQEEKLRHLEKSLPVLTQLILEPFNSNFAFDIHKWNLKERFDSILGEDKWWFRSSGPIEFFTVIKAFFFVINHLKKLATPVRWKYVFLEAIKDRDDIINFEYKKIKNSAPQMNSLAKHLCIQVNENKKQKVKLQLPSTVLSEIKNYMDKEVIDSLEKRGINIDDKVREAVKNGLPSGPIFETEEGNKEYHVWLE